MEKIEWKAPEYIHTEKTSDWFWVVGIISISITIICFILGNVIFGLLILISSITLSLYAARPPEMIKIEIDNSGIKIGDIFHSFEDINSFWVENGDAYPRMFIKSKKKISMYIRILLEDTDPIEVRDFLSKHIPEIRYTEPLLEKFMIYLGF